MQNVTYIKQGWDFFDQTLEITKELCHIFLTLHILHKVIWLALIKSLFFMLSEYSISLFITLLMNCNS